MVQAPRIPQPTTTPNTGTPGRVRGLDPLLVGAFGDSLMWGQGVARAQRFSQLITAELGRGPSREGVLTYDRSRSGAVMVAPQRAQREEFADTFPHLFGNGGADRVAFVDGGDEGIASRLFEEIPASFPSVEWQVGNLTEQQGSSIQVALISGGANDINFEDILNPTVGAADFVGLYRPQIEEICFRNTRTLLTQARLKMPNAVLVLFGYHLPFSYESDTGQLTEFFKHEFDNPFRWWLNWAASPTNLPFLVNVDKTVLEAQVRSIWAQNLATCEQRRAVTDVNLNPDDRGPGVVFVPGGYQQLQAAFAPNSFIWDSYVHPVSDPMQAERVQRAPRAEALNDLEAAYNATAPVPRDLPWTGGPALAARINGPGLLRDALAAGRVDYDVWERLGKEVSRVRRSLIASLMHPNTNGHELYAQMALGRLRMHRSTMTALANQPAIPQPDPIPRPQTEEPLEALLVRTGLRSSAPLAADIGHQFIDSAFLTVTTSPDSDRNFAPDVHLVLVLAMETGQDRQVFCQLNQKYWRAPERIAPPDGDRSAPSGGVYGTGSTPSTPSVSKFFPQFEPGTTDELAVDVSGWALGPNNRRSAERRVGVLLRDLLGVRLVLSRWPVAQTWQPTRVRLALNGLEVANRDVSGTRLGPNDSLDLEYPAPAPPPPAGPPSTVVDLRADNAEGNVIGPSTGRVTG